MFTKSNAFSTLAADGGWNRTTGATDSHRTVLTSGQDGYDGSTNAWKFAAEENGADPAGSDQQTYMVQPSTKSGIMTYSLYAKAGNVNYVRLLCLTTSGDPEAVFELTGNGSVTYTSNVVDTSITKVGDDGWYRISLTFNRTLNLGCRIHLADGDGVSPALSDSIKVTDGDFIYIQNAQLEYGLVATEYMDSDRSTGLGGIREDEPRFDYTGGGCPKLLMEMGSINKQTYSEYLGGWNTLNLSLTTNAAKSPEGVKNASKIVESTDTGLHRFDKQWTFVDGTIYSLSFFAKAAGRNKIEVKYGTNTVANFHATFTLDGTDPVNSGDGTASMQAMGDGWYRCKIENIEGHRLDTGDIHQESLSTAFNILLHNDANPTENNYEGDGSSGVLIYGFQQEEKPFATSYIDLLF